MPVVRTAVKKHPSKRASLLSHGAVALVGVEAVGGGGHVSMMAGRAAAT